MCLPTSGVPPPAPIRSGNRAAPENFLGVEQLSGVVGRAVLGAAAAFHAGIGLQRVDAGDILAGIQAEILIAFERRNPAEALRGAETP